MSLRERIFGVNGNLYSQVKEGIPKDFPVDYVMSSDNKLITLKDYLKSTTNWDEAIDKITEWRDNRLEFSKPIFDSFYKGLDHIIQKSPDSKDVASVLEGMYRKEMVPLEELYATFKLQLESRASIGARLKEMNNIDDAIAFLDRIETEKMPIYIPDIDKDTMQVNTFSTRTDHDDIISLNNILRDNKASLEKELMPVETAKPKHSVVKYVGTAVAVIGVGIVAYELAKDLPEYMKINNHLLPDAISAKAAAKSALDNAQANLNHFVNYVNNFSIVETGQSIWKGVTKLVNALSNVNLPVPDDSTYNLVDKVAQASDKLTQGDFASQFPQNAYPDGSFLEPINGNPHLIHPGETLDYSPVTNQAAGFLKDTLNSAKSAYDVAGVQVSALSAKASHLKDNLLYRGIGGAVAAIASGAAYFLSKMRGGDKYNTPQTPNTNGPDGSGKETDLENKVDVVAEPSAGAGGKKEETITANYTNNLESRAKPANTKTTPDNVVYLRDYAGKSANPTSEHTGISGMYQSYLADMGRKTTKANHRVEERLNKCLFLMESPDFSVKYAVNELGVSASTVRRDLKLLSNLQNNYRHLEMKVMAA